MSYDEIILSSVAAEIAAMQHERPYCDLPDNHPVHRYPLISREPMASPARDMNTWLRGH